MCPFKFVKPPVRQRAISKHRTLPAIASSTAVDGREMWLSLA